MTAFGSSVALILIALTITPSAATMAAVAVYSVNAERKWPADEREPAITSETLRLLEAATRAIAGDWKVDKGKLADGITGFASARATLDKLARGDKERPVAAREVLLKGRAMIDALAASVARDDAATRKPLADLKQAADQFDRRRPVRDQADVLERYFRQSSAVLKALLEAPGDRASTTG